MTFRKYTYKFDGTEQAEEKERLLKQNGMWKLKQGQKVMIVGVRHTRCRRSRHGGQLGSNGDMRSMIGKVYPIKRVRETDEGVYEVGSWSWDRLDLEPTIEFDEEDFELC